MNVLPLEYNIFSELLLGDADIIVMSEIFCCLNYADCKNKLLSCVF